MPLQYGINPIFYKWRYDLFEKGKNKQMSEFEIILYKKENWNIPVDDFIDSLNIKLQAKVLTGIKLLKANGNLLREPYTKHLKEVIFELRSKQGSDITRVLYFFRCWKTNI